MPLYNYKCPACGYEYSENRLVIHPQIITKCPGCKNADLAEIS